MASSRAIWFSILFITVSLLASLVGADCECGYSSTINATSFVFTDIIESDMVHVGNISYNTDWRRQVRNVTALVNRGPYGENYTLDDVFSNMLVDNYSYAGPSQLSGDAGLQLYVRGGVPADGYIPVSEVDSSRTDLLWGSFRASMKLSDVPGTCAAFFWYYSDSMEYDMEFLSSQFDKETQHFPINLVQQSAHSAAQGFADKGANSFVVANLTFDPTIGFHEYRIDIIPGKAIFYADSKILTIMQASNTLADAGHLILTHWSNGDIGWSAGPPASDAIMTVSYVKSYFNSSLSSRQSDYAIRCTDPKAVNAVCAIPDQSVAPDPDGPNGNVTANTFFFSNMGNMTNNQTVYHKSHASVRLPNWSTLSVMLAGFLLMAGVL